MSTYYTKDFRNEDGSFRYYTNPVKAIRAKCVYDCCAGSSDEVDKCTCTECFLHPFRFGKNPFAKKRVLTDEQKNSIVERLKRSKESNG